MGFLRKTDSNPERELEQLRSRKDALHKQLAVAEQKLTEAVEVRCKALVESDSDAGQPAKVVVHRLI